MRDAGQGGFTLLEALVAMAVFGIFVSSMSIGLATCNIVWARGQSRAEVQQQGRIALDRIAREIRVSGYDPPGVIATLPSPHAIQVAQADRLTFVGDVDRNGTLDEVTYRLSAGTLVREVSTWDGFTFPAATPAELCSGFVTLGFSYYDGNDTELPAPVDSTSLHDIRRITVAVVTTASTVGKEASLRLVEDVRVRNLCQYH